MAYGLKYTIRWLTVSDDNLYFNIYQKDYEGTVTELTGAGNVCKLAYESGDDRIVNAFKPSKCTVQYFNEASVPLLTFYSEDDQEYLGKLIDGNDDSVRWAGFMVQDDCSEMFTDPPYPVTLTFTDNIGLLKNITFDQAVDNYYVDDITRDGTIFSNIIQINMFPYDPLLEPGDFVYIDNLPYEVVNPVFVPATRLLQIAILTSPGDGIYNIEIRVKNSLIGKHTLWSILRLAIQNTGILLPIRVYNNLYEVTHDEDTNMFNQVRIFSGKWVNDQDIWTNIYAMAEEVLITFNASLFQADGFWNIVRWGDVRKFDNNEAECIEYDENFKNPFTITIPLNYDVITPNTGVEMVNADAQSRILRPFKIVKETFNYEQPRELMRNLNLQELGELLDEYEDDDGNTVREYEAPYWVYADEDGEYNADYFIRVITDPTGTEITRYMVYRNGGVFGGNSVVSEVFYMRTGDRVNFSMTFQTSESQTDPIQMVFLFKLVGEADTFYMRWDSGGGIQDGSWTGSVGAVYLHPDGVDLLEWQTWEVRSLAVPFDGYFQISLCQLDNDSPYTDTHYKDMRVTYIPAINDNIGIIGHTHTDTLPNSGIKNNYDEEITIDDSPRNAVQGALFLDVVNGSGRYDTLTTLWGNKGGAKNKRLGQFITLERHTMAREPRTLIDCAFTFDCPLLTPMNIVFISSISNLNFIFGVCEFDLMNMICNATLWELHKTDEAELETEYEFKYLYQIN